MLDKSAKEILKKQHVFDRGMLRSFLIIFFNILPAKLRVRLLYFKVFHKFPNLKNPKRFNEKLANYKLNVTKKMIDCADKILVKDYVSNILGDEWVIPNIYVGDKCPSERVLNKLTLPFVIKANHGSSWNIFITSQDDIDIQKIEKITEAWLGCVYGTDTTELNYAKIKPRILIEPHITNGARLPLDYKIFVFNGKSIYIQVDVGRGNEHKRTFFDIKWNKQTFQFGQPIEDSFIQRPHSLDKMIKAAEKLGKEFPFVRVDFYEINKQPVFGEMTFFPGGGTEKFNPPEYDLKFGNLWK